MAHPDLPCAAQPRQWETTVKPASLWLALLVGTLLAATPMPVLAQALTPSAAKAFGHRASSAPAAAQSTPQGTADETAPVARVRDSERVRHLLRSVHGFTREALDAASADVPAVLQGLIATPGEPLLMRREAIKALALYPGAAALAFVQGRLASAPTDLKRLFLVGLARFANVDAPTVSALLARGLADADVTVRWAAARSAIALAGLAPVQAMLTRHAGTETDPALRTVLRKALAPR